VPTTWNLLGTTDIHVRIRVVAIFDRKKNQA